MNANAYDLLKSCSIAPVDCSKIEEDGSIRLNAEAIYLATENLIRPVSSRCWHLMEITKLGEIALAKGRAT